MTNVGLIALLGFTSAFMGVVLGFSGTFMTKRLGRRFEGSLEGFTAGLLIAFVCFRMLEEGFSSAPLYVGVGGILAGVFCACLIDGYVSESRRKAENGERASIIATLGIMLHHFPEGVALGGMCAVDMERGAQFALIIALHCVPEAAAVFVPLKKERLNFRSFSYVALALSLPMLLGSVAGMFLKELSGMFLSLSLTFAGGVMLYITCGEMLPDSKRVWNGRLTTVCALLGFILGVVITA